jgi:hypothetical protein
VKIFMPAGAKKLIYAPYVEHVPPDTTVGILSMKNRDPANWRDAWQIEAAVGKYIIFGSSAQRGGVDQGARRDGARR